MSRQVYHEGDFKVYRAGNNYIVHNAKHSFGEAHTHVGTLKTAKNLIYLTEHRIIPKTFPEYLLISLIRISDDLHYTNEIQLLIDIRRQKGKKLRYVH